MDAYSIEQSLNRARAAAKKIDIMRVDHQSAMLLTIYQMLETLLEEAADNAADRALRRSHQE